MKSALSGIWNRVPPEGLHHRIISPQSNENAARRAPPFPVHRRLGAGPDGHALHLARADRVGPARAGIRKKDRHQGGAVAGAQRKGGAARHHRGARAPLQRRRRREERPGEGGDGAREALRGARLALSRRPAGGRGAEAPLVDPRPHEFLRRCLQHGESAARRAAEELSRLSRPEMEGAHRHRGDRRRMDGDARQGVGYRGRPRAFPQAGGAQARRAQGARAARRADRGGRGPGRTDGIQRQCREPEEEGRADRLAAGAAGGGAAAGHRSGAQCSEPESRARVRGLRAFAGRPAAARIDGQGAGQHQGAHAPQRFRVHDRGPDHGARRAGQVEQALGRALHPCGSEAMSVLPADALALAGLVFLLGLRHGLDPDHLVAIDGLTRASAREGTRRWYGLFFSLGHGVVITLVGLPVAIAATEWRAPVWLGTLGTTISVAVLLMLGLANLAMAWRTPAERPVPLVGIRGRWLAEQVSRGGHPAFIAAIGAAFALSFDTISHALAFSLTGAALAGWLFATLLGIVFTLGMALVDALNGFWVAKMRGSRAMSIGIALLCLAVASSAVSGLEVAPSHLAAAGVVLVAGAYLLASRAARSTYGDANSPYGTAKNQ